jgi:hypothetical protein
VSSIPKIAPKRAGERTMTIADVEQIARVVAIGTGIIFGAAAISSVSWVWLRRQIFAYGGSVLSITGIILIGLSIYKTVDVRAAPDGIGIKLAEVEKLLKDQAEAQRAAQTKLAQLPPDIGPKLIQLDKAVKEQGALQAAQLKEFRTTYDPYARYTTGSKATTSADYKATAPIKMDFVRGDDGKTSMMVFAPDFKDPAYIEQLRKEIDEAVRKQGSSNPSLVSLYMALGDAYLAKGAKDDALSNYQQGVEILRSSK